MHQYLPLESLSVIDQDTHATSFRIESNVKTFTVVADDLSSKNDWIDEIEQACHEHQINLEEEQVVKDNAHGNSGDSKANVVIGVDGEEHQSSLKYINSMMPRIRKQQGNREAASLSVDLEDIVESRDIDYIDEDDNYDDFDDVEEDMAYLNHNNDHPNAKGNRNSSSPNLRSPMTPKMSMIKPNALNKTPAVLRPGHMETITAAAAVAAAGSSLHAPVPKRLSDLTNARLDAIFKKA